MDTAHREKLASLAKKRRYLYCPNGSHLAIYDDQKICVEGAIQFFRDVEARRDGSAIGWPPERTAECCSEWDF